MTKNKKVAVYTLGCKLNFSESSTISRSFTANGYVRAEKGERADICVINTCSVTEQADKKCREMVRRVVRENPEATVVVTGCYAQLKPEEVAQIQGVDIVVSNRNKGGILSMVENLEHGEGSSVAVDSCSSQELTTFFASYSSSERTRAFLKVQDGCDYSCSYCTIPKARGASRNISIERVVQQVNEIAESGIKEIVLTGVNTGDFGKSTGESFLELLKSIEKVDGIERFRISSIEPNLLNDEILKFCVSSLKFMPHFHIPLQSGCDKILGTMRRRYNTRQFRERIEEVRNVCGDVFLGIDLIVGFPTETDEDFAQTLSFIEDIAPSYVHIFPYSVRADTPAAQMPDQVSEQVKKERVKQLERLNEKLHRHYAQRFLGQSHEVLIERVDYKRKVARGYTKNYLMVEVPFEYLEQNNLTVKEIRNSTINLPLVSLDEKEVILTT